MTLSRVWLPSPNYSAKRKMNQLLILHTAEGARTFRELGNYFAKPSVEVSSHVGIDDTPGQIGEYVRPEGKSWTAFQANDWGEHAELCGFARWSRAEWLNHPVMLANTALWLKEEGRRWGIPIIKVSGREIRDGKMGVCGHKDVCDAGAGGDHWNPGPNFPWDVVIYGAILPNPTPPPPPPPPPPPISVPPFVRNLRVMSPMMSGDDVRLWQVKMRNRGWAINPDGWYGPASESICRQFQAEKRLVVDGIVGPITWRATWLFPVT